MDDDPRKRGMTAAGVKVLGSTGEIGEILDRRRPDEVIIAIPSAPGILRAKVVAACREAAELCRSRGADISFLGMQFACSQKRIPCTLTGAARRSELEMNLKAMTTPIDSELLTDVMKVLDPVRDWTWKSGNWKG